MVEEDAAKDLFWKILLTDSFYSRLIEIKDFSICPPILELDEDDPLDKPAFEQYKKLEKCFDETLDVIKKREDELIDQFMMMMGWKVSDRVEAQKFADAIISGIVGGFALGTVLTELSRDDEE